MNSPPPDFPAAHSMDTEWFAVDDLGNIALFVTDEAGAYPKALELPCSMLHAEGHEIVKAELAAKSLQCIIYGQDFVRNCNLPGPYDRAALPEVPANLRDLSPAARTCLEKGRLPGANFLQMPAIQPAEHVPCKFYYSELDFVMTSDRKRFILLPIPNGITPESLELCRHRAESLGLELILPDPPPPSTHFPAAHSMDTDWFGVDCDGHVAMFSSLSDGAIPESVELGYESFKMAHTFFKEPISPAGRSEIQALLSGSSPSFEKIEEEIGRDDDFMLLHCLLLAPSEQIAEELMSAVGRSTPGAVFRVKVPEPIIYADFVPYDKVKKAVKDGVVLKFRFLDIDEGEGGPLSRLGLYCYEAAGSDDTPFPTVKYESTHKPDHPARLQDLPEALQKRIAKESFKEVSFQTGELIDLGRQIEGKLTMWGDVCAYLDEDTGILKPVPGHEGRYAKEFAKLKAEYGGEYMLTEPEAR